MISTTEVATPNSSKYLQQLCKHWSHKAETAFTPTEGYVQFESGNRVDMIARNDALLVTATTPDGADHAHFQEVFDRHLLRFSFREDLVINWS